MGLFKEFKEDLSEAVNQLVPGGEELEDSEGTDNLVVDTLGEEVDVQSELSKLDGLLEQVKDEAPEVAATPEDVPVEETKTESIFRETVLGKSTEKKENTIPTFKEERSRIMSDSPISKAIEPENVQDETSVITGSTVLTGDIHSEGSFDVQGTINGNITCNGKIVVTGIVNGNSNSSEFFADVAKIEGEVTSTGTVKIGAGSVIIGNITATSAVIAGAVKGDIDVQGPVVVDTSAVIMGNIKSRSVQINNGAVIEGFCSQSYADIDVQGLFDNK